ncbi:hypothetical protein [Mariniluteicoccus endophyticus]
MTDLLVRLTTLLRVVYRALKGASRPEPKNGTAHATAAKARTWPV